MITFKDIEDGTPAFHEYMEQIDRRLREARIPIPARPIRAFQEMAKDGIHMVIAGPIKLPHTERIHAWFERRYGDKLKMDFSIGKAVILVRGDPYVMKLPLMNGRWNGIVDVTKTFEGMTKDLFAELVELDRADMVTAFVWFLERFTKIVDLPPAVTANIDTAILQMMNRNPHYGESKWASLQAAEKTLKAFITQKGKTPPRTHDLKDLLERAEALGLPKGFWPVLALIQCSAGVRYGNGVMLDQAVVAHHASIDLCAFIAEHLSSAAPAPNNSAIGDFVVSFAHAVDLNHNGGLLFKLVMADGAQRRVLFSADLCFFLRDKLKASLSNGRHPDEREVFTTKRDFRNVPPRHPVRIFLANAPEVTGDDWKEPCDRVRTLHAEDVSNAVRFDLTMADGRTVRLTMDSCVVNYFVDYLDGGIEAGLERDLFAGVSV